MTKTATKPAAKPTPKKKYKPFGAGHHASKMTTAKVRQARKSYATGKWTIAALARKYEITNPSMASILRGKTWKHVQ